jgi:uncharacterized membrane protein
MTKQFTSLMLFLLPLTITYAIVSSIGTEGNHYSAPDNASYVSFESTATSH